MGIQIINKTGYKCRVDQHLSAFSCFANYKSHDGSIELPTGSSVMLLLSPKSRVSTHSRIDNLHFSVESGLFFKTLEFSFFVKLMNVGDSFIPVLVGRKTDPTTTRLRGKNGFFVRRYMSLRYDRYILEICKGDIKHSTERKVTLNATSPESLRDEDLVPLLSVE
jgi:hypothetical protein